MPPKGWKKTTLGAVLAKMEGGGTPSKNNADYWNGTIPWASVKDLSGYWLSDTIDFITPEGLKHSSSKLIPAGTIIIATRMAVGKAVRFNKDVAINQDLRALYPKELVDPDFLHQWLIAHEKEIEALGSGSTVKGIRQEALKAIEICLPPMEEQRKMAAILSSVDDAIKANEALVGSSKNNGVTGKLRIIKSGLMSDLLSGRVRVNGIHERKEAA